MLKNKSFPPTWLSKIPNKTLDLGRGQEISDFINTFCIQTKDTVAGRSGQKIVLRDWQEELLKHIFASDGEKLKHRTALVGMARKNGKSALFFRYCFMGFISW
jgi:phage terminase large subunit-like protein